MPRNGSGVYSPPNGTLAVTDTDISSTAYNGWVNDMSTEMTNSLNVQGTAPMLAALNAGGFKVTNMANGVSSGDAVNISQLNSAVPSGSVFYIAANSPPTGYLECNGSSLSTATYANLFAAIGYTFGGSGSSFSLPDLRGEFIRGWDDSRGVDSGRTFGSSQTSANLSHAHSYSDPGHAHSYSDPGHVHGGVPALSSPAAVGGAGGSSVNGSTTTGGAGVGITIAAAAIGITISSAGGGESRPVNVALMPIIKY